MEETEIIEGEVVEIKVWFEHTQTFHRHFHADQHIYVLNDDTTFSLFQWRYRLTLSALKSHSFILFTRTDACHEHSLKPVNIAKTPALSLNLILALVSNLSDVVGRSSAQQTAPRRPRAPCASKPRTWRPCTTLDRRSGAVLRIAGWWGT